MYSFFEPPESNPSFLTLLYFLDKFLVLSLVFLFPLFLLFMTIFLLPPLALQDLTIKKN